jgi:hypothetical protein
MDRAFLNATFQNKPLERKESTLHQKEDINIPAISEKYRKMQIDWTLADDDNISSFHIDVDQSSISYETFNGKEKAEKRWDIIRGRIADVSIMDKPDAYVAELVNDYGISATRSLFEAYFRQANRRPSQEDMQKELNELARGILASAKIIKSKNKKIIYANIFGGDIEVIDKETGKAKTINNGTTGYHLPMISLAGNQFMAEGIVNDIKIFSNEAASCMKKLLGHENLVRSLDESRDGKNIISGSWDASIKIWDKDTGECIKTFECAGPVESVIELFDGQHIAYFCSADGKTRILNKDTGQVIKIIDGENPQEDPRSGISVLHDNIIEFWRLDGARGAEPANILIRGKNILSEYDRFGNFEKERFEIRNEDIATGVYWLQYSNLEAKRLEEKKKFKWGRERLYFDVPLDRIELLGNLIQKIAKDKRIPISFKYLDVESSKDISHEATRFVANFSSVKDAKRLYIELSENDEYLSIKPDREINYLAHNVDGKAHYASGYKEIREQQLSDHMKFLEQIIKNPDGTYTLVSSVGDPKTFSKEEYEKLLGMHDFPTEFRKKWEKSA